MDLIEATYPLVSSAPWLAGKSPIEKWRVSFARKITDSTLVHGFQPAMELMKPEGSPSNVTHRPMDVLIFPIIVGPSACFPGGGKEAG